ncbi:hypothetical protein GCM10007063_21800 [Lentibacillus kapialis]|uniref:Cupin type-2 domain-containing protein n=1 Tax=Lentibacillus kapialis TaxID=340214 RepID=A0A917PY86_9BACI|nr:cupin domain-containing protein [Lentibacillus kapialis]GGJ99192.1 hypothetical protein GCM10007063_21800 [Lentibacillus kapialis]
MRYWIHESEIESYIPLNHELTYNKKVVGRKDGINEVEMIIGEMEEGGDADPHSHEEIEQLMYILEGKMHAKIGGEEAELTAGHSVFIPKKVNHEIKNAGKGNLKFVLIYSPAKGA